MKVSEHALQKWLYKKMQNQRINLWNKFHKQHAVEFTLLFTTKFVPHSHK